MIVFLGDLLHLFYFSLNLFAIYFVVYSMEFHLLIDPLSMVQLDHYGIDFVFSYFVLLHLIDLLVNYSDSYDAS